MRVFVTRQLPGNALDRLSAVADVDVWQGDLPPPYDDLKARARASDGLITLLTDRIDERLLNQSPFLRVVANVAVGYDNIDVASASAQGVAVTNTPGVLAETTADFAFALLMAAARRVVEADRFTREGRWRTWDPRLLLGADIAGACLGIVGLGQIGLQVARRAAGFGMTLLYSSPHRNLAAEAEYGLRQVSMDELLAQSDFVSLHVPLTAQTTHLINGAALERMKQGAILINTARGPVVDSHALLEALHSGQLGAAAIDVVEDEPISPGDPLLSLPNLIVTPHIASASRRTRERMAALAVDNVLAALQGRQPTNCINPEAASKGTVK